MSRVYIYTGFSYAWLIFLKLILLSVGVATFAEHVEF